MDSNLTLILIAHFCCNLLPKLFSLHLNLLGASILLVDKPESNNSTREGTLLVNVGVDNVGSGSNVLNTIKVHSHSEWSASSAHCRISNCGSCRMEITATHLHCLNDCKGSW